MNVVVSLHAVVAIQIVFILFVFIVVAVLLTIDYSYVQAARCSNGEPQLSSGSSTHGNLFA